MTKNAPEMRHADVEALAKYYTEGEIVEIAAVVGIFNYFNRFNDALGMEPTKPGEGLDT